MIGKAAVRDQLTTASRTSRDGYSIKVFHVSRADVLVFYFLTMGTWKPARLAIS